MDPQSNSTRGIGYDYSLFDKNIYGVLTNQTKIEDTIVKTAMSKLSLIPGSVDLASFELVYSSSKDRLKYLKSKLTTLKDNYDYIIIDCPPSLGLLSLNAFNSTTKFININFVIYESILKFDD